MGRFETVAASTFRQHPDYPFVRVGASMDFLDEHGAAPEDQLLVDEWLIEINGTMQPATFKSAEEAMDAVPSILFQQSNTELVKMLIAHQLASGKADVAVRLAFESGKAAGRQEACADLTQLFALQAQQYAASSAASA